MPTLPATATGMPAARNIAPTSSTVVVLPFVPVTATNGLGSARHANSSSPITSMPRSRAAATTGASRGTPGDLTSVAALQQLHAVGRRVHLHAEVAEIGELGPIHADHLLPPGSQHRRRRPARAGEAHDQIGAWGERRATRHASSVWNPG